MLHIIWEIIIPLIVAVLFGWLVLGWLTWRWRRTKVTADQWSMLTDRAELAETHLASAQIDRDAFGSRVHALTADVSTANDQLHDVRSRLARAESEAADLEARSDAFAMLNTDTDTDTDTRP